MGTWDTVFAVEAAAVPTLALDPHLFEHAQQRREVDRLHWNKLKVIAVGAPCRLQLGVVVNAEAQEAVMVVSPLPVVRYADVVRPAGGLAPDRHDSTARGHAGPVPAARLRL